MVLMVLMVWMVLFENVLQVQYKESNAVVTITATKCNPITGLSVNISPLSGTSKLLLEANIMSNAYYVSSFGFALYEYHSQLHDWVEIQILIV